MTNSISEIRDVDCLFITGSNTAVSHPVISYEVIRAVKKGANLIVIDPRRIPLADHATLFIQINPGTDTYVFLAMMHTIINEGWADEAFIAGRTEGFEEFKSVLAEYTLERAALMSGAPVEQIKEAARLYAFGERASGRSIFSDGKGHSSILYAMGITQRSNGTDLVMTLANLSMLCGQIGKPSTGVNPLRGQSNVQGACDTGCLVNVFPGYVPVTDETKRKVLARSWGAEDLPGKVGLTTVEAMHAAAEGKVRAAYIMGENPMMSDPDTSHVEKALRNMDLLVVQDIFPSETAFLAHVILPASSTLEKDGSMTNTERRVQLIHPVVKAPGMALPDWQITGQLATRFDAKMGIERKSEQWVFPSAEMLFNELTSVTPIYAGMSYARLDSEGLQWPCPTAEHPGTPILHTQKFSRGLGKFNKVLAIDPAEQTDDEYPLILSTGRVLSHYHSGTMTRRSPALDWMDPGGYVEINPADAEKTDVVDGQDIVIKSRRGRVDAKVKVSDRVPPGTIFLAFHWRESPANMLTQDFKLDPVAKIPEFKVCAVRLEKPGH